MKLESELDLMGNPFTTLSHSIAVEIGNLYDEAFLNSVKKWAEENGLDEVYLLDSNTMMEVFKLGMEQYQRIYGGLQKPLCKYMEFRDGRQIGGGMEDDVMSMISEQISELRYQADIYNTVGSAWELNRAEAKKLQTMLREAADTIESISAKLQAANMERSAEECGGWIIASERMPKEERCIDPETGYYGRSDDVLCSAYNEYEMRDEIWIDHTIDGEWQTHEWYEGEKLAWMPLPIPYRETNEP